MILILGIGNTLLTDEGVGIVAMNALKAGLDAADDITFLDGGTLSFTLAPAIAECDALLVLDAADLGGPPGMVAIYEGEAMDRFLGGNRKSSVHEVGLLDLMAIARLTNHWPAQRALIGVQPQKIDWGESLTPAVGAAIKDIYREACTIIKSWRTSIPEGEKHEDGASVHE